MLPPLTGLGDARVGPQLGYDVKGGRKFVGYPRKVETIRAKSVSAAAAASVAMLSSGKVDIDSSALRPLKGPSDRPRRRSERSRRIQRAAPTADASGGEEVERAERAGRT
eukprot:49759-Pyramimonas_sp.AAC.1